MVTSHRGALSVHFAALAVAALGGCSGALQSGACAARPPAAEARHCGESPDCGAPGAFCATQVDPGPYQLWENWGNGWFLVGVLNVTKINDTTRVERWAFGRYDPVTNPNGHHHPNGANTQVSVWFGRLSASDPAFSPSYPPVVDVADPAAADAAFLTWATRALDKLRSYYPNTSASFANVEVFRATVVCGAGSQCSLGLRVDPGPAPARRPCVDAAPM